LPSQGLRDSARRFNARNIQIKCFVLKEIGGPGPVGFAAFIHAPTMIGYLVGLAQFAGGLAMLTGVLIRIGAICIIIVMLGALMVHLRHGYDITNDGVEYIITQLLIAIAILIEGGGAYSLGPALPEPLRNL
jgi:putative oxidoreductase